MTQGWEIKEALDHLVDAVLAAGTAASTPPRWWTCRAGAEITARGWPKSRFSNAQVGVDG